MSRVMAGLVGGGSRSDWVVVATVAKTISYRIGELDRMASFSMIE
jgi:hypothetical protein